MTIHAHATYRDGALHLSQPLGLPENASVAVEVTPTPSPSESDIVALRPKAPRFTAEQLNAILAKHAVHVGSLPRDFTREDIYSDHD
jgi:hypothetical protein